MISEISKRYAKALFTAAKQAGLQDKALAELAAVASAINADKVSKDYFSNPLVSAREKETVLKKSLTDKGLMSDVQNFIFLMAQKNRLKHLGEVVSAYEEISSAEKGITTGVVRAAKPVGSEEKKKLEEKINQVLKKKIVLTFKEDPSILGGVIAEVGGWTFDDSIETHLKKLNEALMK